jgi:hypothetical protein
MERNLSFWADFFYVGLISASVCSPFKALLPSPKCREPLI